MHRLAFEHQNYILHLKVKKKSGLVILSYNYDMKSGLRLPMNSVVRLTDLPNMTILYTVDIKQQYNDNDKS